MGITALCPKMHSENCNSTFPEETQIKWRLFKILSILMSSTFNVATTFRCFTPFYKNWECLIKEHLKSFARALQINNINQCNAHFDSNNWKQYKKNDNTNMIQVIFTVIKTTEMTVIQKWVGKTATNGMPLVKGNRNVVALALSFCKEINI